MTKPNRSKRAKSKFLDSYELESRRLRSANSKSRLPAILQGLNSNGEPVLIRRWNRITGQDDTALEAIWKEEIRTLYRLSGSPSAGDKIAQLENAGLDDEGFYVSIYCGQRSPIEISLKSDRDGARAWLRNPRNIINRKRLWSNLRRISVAIESLHGIGIIHCCLDTWSVLSAGDSSPDFQLMGFESALRIAGLKKSGNPEPTNYSTASFMADWRQFGDLIANLLQIDRKRIDNLTIPDHELSDHGVAAELTLIRRLLGKYPSEDALIDGYWVLLQIDDILQRLNARSASIELKRHLALNLGRGSRLSDAIREWSRNQVDASDAAAAFDFIDFDLPDPAELIVFQNGEQFEVALKGSQLIYPLKQFQSPNFATESWDIAFCDAAHPVDKWHPRNIVGSHRIPKSSIEYMTLREVRDRQARLRGKTLSWQNDIDMERTTDTELTNSDRLTLHAFGLLQLIELAEISAQNFPVRTKTLKGREGLLQVTLRNDLTYETLSKNISKRSPSQQIVEMLDSGQFNEGGAWIISDSKKLANNSANELTVVYSHYQEDEKGLRIFFRPSEIETIAPPKMGYLRAKDSLGSITQFQRRSSALIELGQHRELLRMLSDPTGRVIKTDRHFQDSLGDMSDLDEAKRSAFAEIARTLPLSVVQGPPGVGKTFLIRKFVKHQFSHDPATRMLLTAQSNQAVDHLLDELSKDLHSQSSKIIAIRTKGAAASSQVGPFDISATRADVVKMLTNSSASQITRPELRARLIALNEKYSSTNSDKHPEKDTRIIDDLLLRSANIVLTTANDKTLERMSELRSFFDWTFIEEAAKASGNELIRPTLLSHRRVMIGDHKQLPPFASSSLIKLLKQPETLREALPEISSAIDLLPNIPSFIS